MSVEDVAVPHSKDFLCGDHFSQQSVEIFMVAVCALSLVHLFYIYEAYLTLKKKKLLLMTKCSFAVACIEIKV
jgi:hypothetical protein